MREVLAHALPVGVRMLSGATGLEPATSGVTGRSCCFRADRAGIPRVGRAFRPWRCGDSRVRAGACDGLLRDQRGIRRCLLGKPVPKTCPQRSESLSRRGAASSATAGGALAGTRPTNRSLVLPGAR
jgi:hypothetical protein